MEIKEITSRLEPLLNEDGFLKELKSNPIKAIEKKLGFKIPTDQLKPVLEFIKSKVDIGDISKLIADATAPKGFLAKILGIFKK